YGYLQGTEPFTLRIRAIGHALNHVELQTTAAGVVTEGFVAEKNGKGITCTTPWCGAIDFPTAAATALTLVARPVQAKRPNIDAFSSWKRTLLGGSAAIISRGGRFCDVYNLERPDPHAQLHARHDRCPA
ncbi:unnamed protein product, partial [Phaeothamnion confervicola]